VYYTINDFGCQSVSAFALRRRISNLHLFCSHAFVVILASEVDSISMDLFTFDGSSGGVSGRGGGVLLWTDNKEFGA